MAEAIRIGDPAIEIRLRRSGRARRMTLRVAHVGAGPTLTLPPGVPIAKARAFLSDQEGWLRRHMAARPAGAAVGDGTVLPFGDRTLTIRAAAGRAMVHQGGVLAVPGPADGHAVRVAAWLREEARRACVAAVDRHAAKLGLKPGRISLRDPRSRWGSCTASGDLMFSWRLVMAPVGGLRLRRGARGGASRRAQPLAALLGGGAAALPGLSGLARLAAAERGGAPHP